MKLSLKKENIFIPEKFGNKDLPEIDQIRVIWRYPTGQEKMSTLQSKYSGSGDVVFANTYRELVEQCVIRIENLSIADDDGKEVLVTTGKELADARGVASLYEEVANFISSANDILDKKK